MIVFKVSIISGKQVGMDLDITPEQYEKWKSGEGLVQDIFPNLSAPQREFLISGITPEDWDSVMGVFEE